MTDPLNYVQVEYCYHVTFANGQEWRIVTWVENDIDSVIELYHSGETVVSCEYKGQYCPLWTRPLDSYK